jgi:hypothetical protein
VPVLAVSALTGDGLDELRREIDRRAAARSAAVHRLEADVEAAAGRMRAGCEGTEGRSGRAERDRLVSALSQAAGVPAVVRAVGASHRRRGAMRTGWPFVRWAARVRPDPLRRLRLGDANQGGDRTSCPPRRPCSGRRSPRPPVGSPPGATADLAPPWPALVRNAATARETELADRLDRAVAGADLRTQRAPRWWALAAFLQKLLAAVVIVGLLWLLVLVGLGFLRLEDVIPLPEVEGIALPTLLAAGGALAGLLLALLLRAVNRAGRPPPGETGAGSARRADRGGGR